MSFNIKVPEKKSRVLVPAGAQVARIVSLLEIGTIPTRFFEEDGSVKHQKKIMLTFEFPNNTYVFEEAKGPEPLVISNEYTYSLDKKSKLLPVVKSLLGIDPKEGEVVDISALVGKECFVQIAHTTKGEDTYANVAGIMSVPTGVTVPPAHLPLRTLTYGSWDQEVYNALPPFIQDKMKTSAEYQKLFGGLAAKSAEAVKEFDKA